MDGSKPENLRWLGNTVENICRNELKDGWFLLAVAKNKQTKLKQENKTKQKQNQPKQNQIKMNIFKWTQL